MSPWSISYFLTCQFAHSSRISAATWRTWSSRLMSATICQLHRFHTQLQAQSRSKSQVTRWPDASLMPSEVLRQQWHNHRLHSHLKRPWAQAACQIRTWTTSSTPQLPSERASNRLSIKKASTTRSSQTRLRTCRTTSTSSMSSLSTASKTRQLTGYWRTLCFTTATSQSSSQLW